MFDEDIKKEVPKTDKDTKTVMPLKDFIIHMNEFHYELEKGTKIEVHKMFLPTLKLEKVIK